MGKGIKIFNTGAWNWNTDTSMPDPSSNLDTGFADCLATFFQEKNQKVIMEFGCATGYLLKYLSDKLPDVELIGVEPNVAQHKKLLYPNILACDLSVPFDLNERGSVICIEVMEHIPALFMATAVENLTRHCTDYLIMSWAYDGQGGHGHVNEKNAPEVVKIFFAQGFDLLTKESKELQDKSTISWLKHNILVFKKKT